jgi:uncharacterized membrane protein
MPLYFNHTADKQPLEFYGNSIIMMIMVMVVVVMIIINDNEPVLRKSMSGVRYM